ncbi:MAG: hypothetical protein WBB29_09925 [Geitlerinemataceae cyanobacterium]
MSAIASILSPTNYLLTIFGLRSVPQTIRSMFLDVLKGSERPCCHGCPIILYYFD